LSHPCGKYAYQFQASSFTGVGGEWGDRQKDGSQAFLNRSLYKISKLLPHFAQDGQYK